MFFIIICCHPLRNQLNDPSSMLVVMHAHPVKHFSLHLHSGPHIIKLKSWMRKNQGNFFCHTTRLMPSTSPVSVYMHLLYYHAGLLLQLQCIPSRDGVSTSPSLFFLTLYGAL